MSWQYRLVDTDSRGNPPPKRWEIFVIGTEGHEQILATVYTERMAIDLVEGNKVIGAAIDLATQWDIGDYEEALTTLADTVFRYAKKVSP